MFSMLNPAGGWLPAGFVAGEVCAKQKLVESRMYTTTNLEKGIA